MEQNMEQLIEHFVNAVENYAKDKGKRARYIKQRAKKVNDGYKGVSSVIDFEDFKVRFAYLIDEGRVFKKGIITLFLNIKDYEYHFADILAQIAEQDKECVVYPYVDNADTMDKCLNMLFKKLDMYKESIEEVARDEAKRKRLEKMIQKDMKTFSGSKIPKEGSLALMMTGIYSNTALIRYTSEPYEAYLNGNYKKALRLYGKEGNLVKYEKQLVKLMKDLIKKKEVVKLPEEQLTINRKKQVKKESIKYTALASLVVFPVVVLISVLLYDIFVKVVASNSEYILVPSKVLLSVPIVALTLAFVGTARNYFFKGKIQSVVNFNMLNKAKENRKRVWTRALAISSILIIAIIAATSITFRAEGIKYSNDILDFKGTIVPYSEVDYLDEKTQEIKLKNSESILLETYDYDISSLKEVLEKNIKK